jgi:hypothetical protein
LVLTAQKPTQRECFGEISFLRERGSGLHCWQRWRSVHAEAKFSQILLAFFCSE